MREEHVRPLFLCILPIYTRWTSSTITVKKSGFGSSLHVSICSKQQRADTWLKLQAGAACKKQHAQQQAAGLQHTFKPDWVAAAHVWQSLKGTSQLAAK